MPQKARHFWRWPMKAPPKASAREPWRRNQGWSERSQDVTFLSPRLPSNQFIRSVPKLPPLLLRLDGELGTFRDNLEVEPSCLNGTLCCIGDSAKLRPTRLTIDDVWWCPCVIQRKARRDNDSQTIIRLKNSTDLRMRDAGCRIRTDLIFRPMMEDDDNDTSMSVFSVQYIFWCIIIKSLTLTLRGIRWFLCKHKRRLLNETSSRTRTGSVSSSSDAMRRQQQRRHFGNASTSTALCQKASECRRTAILPVHFSP